VLLPDKLLKLLLKLRLLPNKLLRLLPVPLKPLVLLLPDVLLLLPDLPRRLLQKPLKLLKPLDVQPPRLPLLLVCKKLK
jgi:hypothetical protein